jgi:hypothetical protein
VLAGPAHSAGVPHSTAQEILAHGSSLPKVWVLHPRSGEPPAVARIGAIFGRS